MVWVESRFPEEIESSSCETNVLTEVWVDVGASRAWKFIMLEAEEMEEISMRWDLSIQLSVRAC
jgi:hypothetical protein